MKPSLTAGQIAEADQLAAEAGHEVAILRLAIAGSDAVRGEAQTLANFIAYLSKSHPSHVLAAMLVVAVRDRRMTP